MEAACDQSFAWVDFRAANASERVQWYLTDHLNSVRLVLDETGAVLDQIAYDAFGNIVAQLNPLLANPILFASREFDAETGLYYHRARYLDPSTGRWTTQDPLGFAAGDANLYRYVGNRATLATDPSGNIFFVPFVVGALFVAGGSVGLHVAANRYDHASSILARPPSPANDAEFRRVYNQARWIHAGSNVAVVSGGALIVSPGIGYGAGWIAGTGTVGARVVKVAVVGGIAYVGWDGYTICRDWNIMRDDAERFERIGTLLGPLATGAYPGYRGFMAGRASGRAFVASEIPVLPPAIRLRSGTTMAEILQGVPDDAMIHLTRQPTVHQIVRSGGMEYGTSMVRAGDVRGMTLQQYRVSVVGPIAEARAADADTFLIVHPNHPQFGTIRPWPRPDDPIPGTSIQEFRPVSLTNIMPDDIIRVQPQVSR